jgi:zinc finger protein
MAQVLDAESLMDDQGITQLESYCVNCQENGSTKLLLVRVPYFRDILIMSFECPHCGFRSNEVQPAEGVSESGGIRITVQYFVGKEDKLLNRQVIKSNYGVIRIPEVEFEIPSMTQRGEINTIEGFLANAASNLQEGQEERRKIDPETTDKIQKVIDQLVEFSEGKRGFTFVVDDPSGNSFVENPYAPANDIHAIIERYEPTRRQLKQMGFLPDDAPEEEELEQLEEAEEKRNEGALAESNFGKGFQVAKHLTNRLNTFFDVTEKMANFPGKCHSCHSESEVRMCMTEIPNFGEIVIMVSQCDQCGYKDAEVKPGGGISPLGKRITLRVTSIEDLSRDLLKSESASISIPEVDLELGHGTLGGKYTTIEGILEDIYLQLNESNPFALGDTAEDQDRSTFQTWMEEFNQLKSCDKPFTVIIDDPLGKVFVYNPHFPKPDPNLTIEEYSRTFEQDEEFGLNDIRTENYENDDKEE